MAPFVDVQHPENGEFSRYFVTDEEADRYVIHMRRVRGYFAEKRKMGLIPERALTREVKEELEKYL